MPWCWTLSPALIPARWGQGVTEFLFFGAKVHVLSASVSSAELEVPGARECSVFRTVLMMLFPRCQSIWEQRDENCHQTSRSPEPSEGSVLAGWAKL